MKHSNQIHPDLLRIQQEVYIPMGLDATLFEAETESKAYGACQFRLNHYPMRFRSAKITPTKVGQFVTFWKRDQYGPICPFSTSDLIDFLVISTRTKSKLGHFIFPKQVLEDQGILSSSKKEGKRALRVYPPWDVPTNRQARVSQEWQLKYFLEISPDGYFNKTEAQKLYSVQIR